jgi:hypothetical protein
MFFTFKLFSIASLVTAFLVSSITAQWPKRGLAANDDIPIWQFGGYWEGAPSEVNWQYNWGIRSKASANMSLCCGETMQAIPTHGSPMHHIGSQMVDPGIYLLSTSRNSLTNRT